LTRAAASTRTRIGRPSKLLNRPEEAQTLRASASSGGGRPLSLPGPPALRRGEADFRQMAQPAATSPAASPVQSAERSPCASLRRSPRGSCAGRNAGQNRRRDRCGGISTTPCGGSLDDFNRAMHYPNLTFPPSGVYWYTIASLRYRAGPLGIYSLCWPECAGAETGTRGLLKKCSAGYQIRVRRPRSPRHLRIDLARTCVRRAFNSPTNERCVISLTRGQGQGMPCPY